MVVDDLRISLIAAVNSESFEAAGADFLESATFATLTSADTLAATGVF